MSNESIEEPIQRCSGVCVRPWTRVMAKTSDAWTVLEHGPLQKLSDNLWRVEGAMSGMTLRRTMTVARLGDGRLVIHSAIALAERELSELEALGTPSFLIVPNAYHRQDAPAYKRRYPALTVLAPSGSRRGVAQVLAVDGGYEDFPQGEAVELAMLPGIADTEGALLVRSSDGLTVVLNDVVFNMDRKKDVVGYVITSLLGSAPGPRVSRLVKLMMVKDRALLRAELERLAALPDLVRVVVSHEKLASGAAAAEVLRQAATFL